jgi:hypothetical protein
MAAQTGLARRFVKTGAFCRRAGFILLRVFPPDARPADQPASSGNEGDLIPQRFSSSSSLMKS